MRPWEINGEVAVNAYTDAWMVPWSDNHPTFLRCCPAWLRNTEAVQEVADAWYWTEKQCLAAVFHPKHNPMPIALKAAVKAYDAGFHRAERELIEKERKKK